MKNKILACVLAFTFVTPSIAFANEIPTLTTQEATTRAINNSRGIRNTQDSITLISEGEQRIRDIIWDTPSMPAANFLDLQINLMRLDANRAVSLSSINAQRETLGFIVTNHFSNILMAQNELALFDQNLSILERDLIAVQLMQSLGMASTAQLNQITTAQRQAQSNRANLELSLENAFLELNRLMGTPQNQVYNLVFEPEFSSVAGINLNNYIRLHQGNNIQIANAQNQLTITQFERDNHRLPTQPVMGFDFESMQMVQMGEVVVPGGTTRAEREVAVTQAQREVTNAREQVENNVVDLFNNILNLELAIGSLELQLEILEQNLATQYLQYNVGHITSIELDRGRLALAELDENIRRMKVNHYMLVMQLTNPNIALGF